MLDEWLEITGGVDLSDTHIQYYDCKVIKVFGPYEVGHVIKCLALQIETAEWCDWGDEESINHEGKFRMEFIDG